MTTSTLPAGLDISEAEIKEHFEKVMHFRKAKVRYDRFEAARVQSDGLRLHLDVIAVEQERPTLVFIPGTSVYGLIFGDFLAAMADCGVNVVSVDPRGHGRSEGDRGDYTISGLVADGRAAIRYARERFHGPVFVAGSSQGGIVAFYLAASENDLAGAICHNAADLADTANAGLTDHPLIAKALRPVVVGLSKLAPKAKFNIQKYFALLSRGDQNIKDWLAADPLALKTMSLRALASLTTTKLTCPVEQIKTPILILHGGRDRMFPQSFIEGLYGRLTCPKDIKIYSDVGHFLVTDHAERIAPDVHGWMVQHSELTS